MQLPINIKGTGIELTDAIRAAVEEKIGSLRKFIPDSDTTVHAAVDIGKSTEHHQHGEVFYADVLLRVAGAEFYAKARREDLYAAIDEVKDMLSRDLRKRNNKKTDLIRRGGAAVKDFIRRFYE